MDTPISVIKLGSRAGYLVAAVMLILWGCKERKVSEGDLPGKYVAVGHVPDGGKGTDYFVLNPDGTFQRYLKGESDKALSVTSGKWRLASSEDGPRLTVDGFRWAPWQVPPGFPSGSAMRLRSVPGVSVGDIDYYRGNIRVRFMSDVDYWFERNK